MARPERIRSRLLDAAHRLVREEGPSRLTLDAVARLAGASKGGLLHHFPTKEGLVAALVGLLIERFESAHQAAAAADHAPAGRFTRAYVEAYFPLAENADAEGQRRAATALLAAVASDPALLEPLRARYRDWQASIEADGIDPTAATIVRLAADGLWLAELLGLPPLAPDRERAVLERLRAMTRPPAAGEP